MTTPVSGAASVPPKVTRAAEGGRGEDRVGARRGPALHPPILGQDRRGQVRRQRPARRDRRRADGDGSGVAEAAAAGPPGFVRPGRRADACRRHPARRGARWRASDRRAHGQIGQGDGIPQRPARHRCRHPRHRPHGPGRQGEPRHRVSDQRARAAGRGHVGRGCQPHHGRSEPRRPRVRRQRLGGGPDHAAATGGRGSDPGRGDDRRGRVRSGLQHQRRHGRRRTRRGPSGREADLPHRHRGAPRRSPTTRRR